MTGGERWETTPGRPAPVMSVATEKTQTFLPHYLPVDGRFTWPLVGLPAAAFGLLRLHVLLAVVGLVATVRHDTPPIGWE